MDGFSDLHAPGEDGSAELIAPRRQNVYLGVVAIVVFLVVAGVMAGAL